MASHNKYQTASAVEAILLEAKNQGVRNLTRTTLTKCLYLLDFWMAKENNGKVFLDVEWKFHHFGPYSEAIAADLEWLPKLPAINIVSVAKQDKEMELYSLNDLGKSKDLEGIGIPVDVRHSLIRVIRAFANDLTGLLNFVYFETEPMENVRPGQVLSFDSLKKTDFKKDIKPIPIPSADRQKNERIKQLANSIGKRWQAATLKPLSNPPIKDIHYLESLDSEISLDVDNEYFASVEFTDNKK